MAKIKLDLHPIYNNHKEIEKSLKLAIEQAVTKKIKILEIIPGKGSGVLKDRVLRYLRKKDVKNLYKRIDKDSKNFGRIFVYF
jgi:dsDNA-specific endonuclease/ATPase MutS2